MTSPQPAPMPGGPQPLEAERLHPTQRILLVGGKVVGYVVYFYVLAVEIILGLGFLLLLAGANPTSGFVRWMYRNLDRTMEPFRGIFTPIQLGTTSNQVESVFETSILFAMVIYAILAIALHALISWLSGRVVQLDREDRDYQRRRDAAAYGGASGSSPGAPPPAAR